MLQWRASRKGREKWREEGLAERGLVRLGKGGGAGVGQKEGARTGVVGWPLAHLGSGPLPRAQTKIFFLIFFAEGHWPGPRQRFFFWFFEPSFFVVL